MEGKKSGFYTTHPGEVLKEELEYRKIDSSTLAKEIDVPEALLNDILEGKQAVTATLAYLFEAALDIPASMLLKLQMQYDMRMAETDESLLSKIAAIRKVAALL
jgi:addiction module HigA family antidote